MDHIKHKDDTLLFVIGDHGMTSTGKPIFIYELAFQKWTQFNFLRFMS